MEILLQCPLCKSTESFTGRLAVRDHLVSGQDFGIQQCLQCGFMATNPQPKELEINDFYQSDDYIAHTGRKKTFPERLYHLVRRHMLRRKRRLISKHLNNNNIRLLDYGCGTGDFVLAAEKAGFRATGYEPNPAAAGLAKEKGVSLLEMDAQRQNNILQARSAERQAAEKGVGPLPARQKPQDLPGNTYQAITLWHVLEHLHDFPGKLSEFHRLLAPGGLLVLAAPMANSSDAAYYKEHWAAWDVPRHLWHFTPETLTKAVTGAGFDLRARHPLPFDSYYISLLSEQHKGRNRLSAALRAMIIGTWSNMRARRKKTPWSGEIFVFTR